MLDVLALALVLVLVLERDGNGVPYTLLVVLERATEWGIDGTTL